MTFIILAIIILVISFILALISLIREQRAISTSTQSDESRKSGEGQEIASDSAVSFPKVAAFDFGDSGHPPMGETGQSTQISTPAARKPFFWEEQPKKQQVDAGQTETQGTTAGGTWELWRNKREIQVGSKEPLSGEISLAEMTQKDQK